jgi:shikimate 5-dehydrogenase
LAQTVSLVEQYWPNTSINASVPADILIDATPNGKNANAAPLFAPDVLSGCRAVCDIAGQHGESQLLATAEQMEKVVIDAADMGHCQVHAQMSFLLQDQAVV